MPPPNSRSLDVRRAVCVLILFGVVFGYVEAAAVVYIRIMYEPIHRKLFPERPATDLFPLYDFEQWSREGPAQAQNPALEVGRELGTIVVVALIALIGARSVAGWFAGFVLAFGVWDLAYYAWLRLLIGWPVSLFDWDLLFAAPLPWVAPVLAPLLVAAVMVVTGCLFFWREAMDRPLRPRWWHWTAVLAGALVIMTSFWWDARNILLEHGLPNPFNWPLFALGLAMGVAGFGHAFLTSPTAE